jgi:hypothetical protein
VPPHAALSKFYDPGLATQTGQAAQWVRREVR